MTKIYLIRHAESIANTQGVYQGQTYDTALSPRGEQQVLTLKTRFANQIFDKVFVSPLKRTRQTAEALVGGIEISLQIIETNHGHWERLTKQEIAKECSELYNLWLTHPSKVQFPGGERFTDTADRVTTWFDNLIRQSGTFAIVTHANIIQILLTYLNRLDLDSIWDFNVDSTGVTLVEIQSSPKIVYTNDTSHLKGLKSDITQQAI